MGVGMAERLERSVSIFGGTRWRLTELSVYHHSSQGRWAWLFRAIPGMSIILLLAAAAASVMCNASLTLKLDRRMICLALLDNLFESAWFWSWYQCVGGCNYVGIKCLFLSNSCAWTSEKQLPINTWTQAGLHCIKNTELLTWTLSYYSLMVLKTANVWKFYKLNGNAADLCWHRSATLGEAGNGMLAFYLF